MPAPVTANCRINGRETDSQPLLQIENLSCAYDQTPVLNQISLSLAPGDIGCILGPSGCGKSTLLRAIAGFQSISAGHIHLNGRRISDTHRIEPPETRQIGMVFQDYALFPHLSVEANTRFGLKADRHAKERARQMLELVGLADLASRYPHELSGGQQQRVALARALAPQPQLVLLDEPFSSLDAELRKRLSLDVRQILKKAQISAILVTHDQQEAFAMADWVGLIQQGQLVQWDTPYNLYHHPNHRFVASFVGHSCFLPGVQRNGAMIETEIGLLPGIGPIERVNGHPVDVLLRPDDLQLDADSAVRGLLLSKRFAGSQTYYQVKLASGHHLEITSPSHQDLQVGDDVGIRVIAQQVTCFERAKAREL